MGTYGHLHIREWAYLGMGIFGNGHKWAWAYIGMGIYDVNCLDAKVGMM